MRNVLMAGFLLAGCSTGNTRSSGSHDLAGGFTGDGAVISDTDLATSGTGGDGSSSCGTGCYTVYAHSDYELYSIDLSAKSLVDIGPFKAPKVNGNEDVMTDLAVAPDNTIYIVSHTTLYTADPGDGHVTTVATITDCGQDNVALTTTPDGNLYVADYKGAFCKIDLTASPPTVKQIGTLGNNMAISGDLVGVGDGTIYGTAYDTTKSSTQSSNVLVTIDATTGAVAQSLGATGFPKLFGVAYALGQVFAFTHDGTGRVITVDPKTGAGTLFNTFKDGNGSAISFAGAGVNSMVSPVIN